MPIPGNARLIRPDLTVVPLDDVDPAHVALATRKDDRGRLVAEWRKIAQSELKPN